MDRWHYLKPSRIGNCEQRRLLESKNLKEKRSIRRTTNFNLHRNIEDVQEVNKKTNENCPPIQDKTKDRKMALLKFRAKKEAEKKAIQNKKKPPFIVGIPHHGSSPLLRNTICENAMKKVTKPTTSIEFTFKPNKVIQSEKKLTSPQTPTVLKRSVQKKPLNNVSNLTKKFTSFTRISENKKEPEDEVLAAPLTPVEFEEVQAATPTAVQVVDTAAVSGCQPSVKSEPVESAGGSGTSFAVKPEPNVEGGAGTQDNQQNIFLTSRQEKTLRRNPKRSLRVDGNEILRLPSPKDQENEEEKLEVVEVEETQVRDEAIEVAIPSVTISEPEQKNESTSIVEAISDEEGDTEFAGKIAFHLGQLQVETERLLGMAEMWQTTALNESLPPEVADEVDSVVGQTRLLTSDKFQQFRRLVVQCRERTGTHPVTLDDLEGFWDMVYLQVESLEKKYAALDLLKNNNWTKPKPAMKKRRQVKTSKVKKVPEVEKSPKEASQLHQVEDKMQTPTSNSKLLVSSVLRKNRMVNSNSPAPFIAMRLSGIGRGSNVILPLPATPKSERATPKSEPATPKSEPATSNKETESMTVNEQLMPLVTPRRSVRLMGKITTPTSCAACESASSNRSGGSRSQRLPVTPAGGLLGTKVTPDDVTASSSKGKRATKKSLKFSPSGSQQKSDDPEVNEQLMPLVTPRRSVRLMGKITTPTSFAACESASCNRSGGSRSQRLPVTPAGGLLGTTVTPDDVTASTSKGKRATKKSLKFSPSGSQQKSDDPEEPTHTKETDEYKPSTSRVRFSLKPSILTVNENNNELLKKVTKRRQTSAQTSGEEEVDSRGAKSRRSTRLSRKVTFDSGVEDKLCFKLPATPYKKSTADS